MSFKLKFIIPENVNLSVRGGLAYQYWINEENTISDLDIQIDTVNEYVVLKEYLSNQFKIYEHDFYFNDKIIPRRRLELISGDNGESINLDVVIFPNYYIKKMRLEDNLFIPEKTELIAELLISVSNTSIGIINDYSEYYLKKIFKLRNRLFSLYQNEDVRNIISSLEHHIQVQNSFNDSNIEIATIIVNLFKTLSEIADKNVKNKIQKLIFNISETYFHTNGIQKINFFDANDKFGCFSNFSLHKLFYQNIYWQTSEHCYQAQKFLNPDLINKIRFAETPKTAAKLGRTFKEVRPNWQIIKPIIMYNIILQKVLQNDEVLFCLLSTFNKQIFEVNVRDSYWGLGKDSDGLNMLGVILMTIRDELIKN